MCLELLIHSNKLLSRRLSQFTLRYKNSHLTVSLAALSINILKVKWFINGLLVDLNILFPRHFNSMQEA